MANTTSLKGNTMLARQAFLSGLLLLAGLLGGRILTAADAETWDGNIVQHGKMHEAIGQQQHQGRVQLSKLVERPHFYGVAALTKLQGEATILDGKVIVTRVDAEGQLEPTEAAQPDEAATLLVGAYVPSWTDYKTTNTVGPDEFDKYLVNAATKAGINTTKPFVFTVEAEFSKVRFHVINGACPLHARLKKIELPKDKRAFEAEFEKVHGTVVGIFAKDAVGNITHPATSTHMHLIYKDAKTGKQVTGHIEQLGMLAGAVLRLPGTK